MHLVP